MRINSHTTLTRADVLEAAATARAYGHDIHVESVEVKPKGGIVFYCESYNGTRSRNGRPGRAATWTAYGWLIADLFRRDPDAVIGQYKSAADFIMQCQGEHDRCAQYRPTDKDRADISFLDLVR